MSQHEGQQWQLHVWNLEGPQESWEEQLARRAGEQPVFALVGGIGGAQWAPVHGFCERAGVPCLFPHLEAAQAEGGGFYPMYLGEGALLEAKLVAAHAGQTAAAGAPAARITQVLRAHDPAAQAAAAVLRSALAEQGVATRELLLQADAPLTADSFAAVQAQDTLVLWMRPQDLQGLAAVQPVGAQVFVSATLAQRDEVPLPGAWKARALMAYPYALPQQRAPRTARMQRWLQERGVPLTDERVQADAWITCDALRRGMKEAGDHLGRDYLVERVEADMERTTATGLYPRLALGIGQRFASKSGYLVRFDAGGGGLAAVGERIAP